MRFYRVTGNCVEGSHWILPNLFLEIPKQIAKKQAKPHAQPQDQPQVCAE